MNDEVEELTVKAELIESDEVIETVERTFYFLDIEESEEEVESKTLDETITEFLQEIEDKAKEKKFEIPNRDAFYSKSVLSLVLFFIKPDSDSTTLKVPLQPIIKKVEEEDNGKPIDNR